MSSGLLARLRPTFALRLALWYAGLFVISALVLSALTYQMLARSLENRDQEMVRATLAEYASQYEAGGLSALRRGLEARQSVGGPADLFVRVVGSARETVLLSLPRGWAELASAPDDPSAEAGILRWSELPGRAPGAQIEVASLRLRDGTLFQVGRSTEHRVEVLRQFREVLTAMLAVVLVLGLTGGALFTHSALRPVRELTRVASGIVETGRLSERVPAAEGSDPLDALARLFNAMLERLEALVGAMRDSLDNVAHDLRTPLTRLQVVLENALRARDEQGLHEGVADALAETERVTGTLNALLDLSEAETGAMRLRLEAVPVAEVLADAVELYEDLAEDAGVALGWQCPPDLLVRGDRQRLRQVFANLVDNAVKYSPAGGRVEIAARGEGHQAAVTISDTGPGIAPKDRERIWERLYRADPSRSERGLGLGLSLVRAIVRAHGGEATVDAEPGGGARFTVRLPRPEPDREPAPE